MPSEVYTDLSAREDKPWPNQRLGDAAIVGHTSSTSTRIWARARNGGEHWLVVGEAGRTSPLGETAIRRVPTVAAPSIEFADGTTWAASLGTFADEDDRTSVFAIDGLAPGTRYGYGVGRLEGSTWRWIVGRDEPHVFRTCRAGPDSLTFGMFSCHMPYLPGRGIDRMHMWEAFETELSLRDADFVVGMGDQVYCDGHRDLNIWRILRKMHGQLAEMDAAARERVMVSWYRDIYRGYWGHLQLRKVFRSFPTYMIWDDHEIGDGWGSFTDDELSNELDSFWRYENVELNLELAKSMYRSARKVYLEYQDSHNPPRPPRSDAGLDYAFRWGAAAFYALDLRGARRTWRDDGDIRSDVLGKEQRDRFAAWIEQTSNDRDVRAMCIVSAVPLVHLRDWIVERGDIASIKDDLRDQWEHSLHRWEREFLLSQAFKASFGGKLVTFLSGDVHVGGVYELVRGGARIYQLTSSAISNARTGPRLIEATAASTGWLEHDHRDARTWYRRHRVLGTNNFGLVRLDLDSADATARFELYGASADGITARTEPVQLSSRGVE